MDVIADQVTITVLEVPTSVDDPDLRASVDVSNAVEADIVGHDLLSDTYAETLGQWQPHQYSNTVRLLARVGGEPAARGYLGLPLTENRDKYWVYVAVLPQYRRRGIGKAMLRQLEGIADEDGRTTGQSFGTSPTTAGKALEARTGFGSVAADAPGTAFLLAAGFLLEQAERVSQLDLTTDRATFEGALAGARRVAEPDYRLVTWQGNTPEDRLDDVAWMHSRMSTDTPMADLEMDEEVWDAERVREAESRSATQDRYLLTAAAEHVASGRLVAYTVLSVPVAAGRVAWQEDTLVTTEHRGRRLGTLVKAANLLELVRRQPAAPAVFTWNAEENRPMLDVNESLGFRAVGSEGVWQRVDSTQGCSEG
ncbi:MAG: GNAT family N-acetyltransferase [Actinomycetota bacterium]|nr:GNAT family N-acetyltransferase [Actinomycetota bacterium]